jgi:arylsulfatase A-like enzyme
MRRRLRLAATLLVAAALAGCGDPPEPGVERVILVGVDGLDWRVLEPLIREGRLPHLARFIDSGVSGDLATLKPAYSPIIWASVATGKLPPKHGITGFVRRPSEPGGRRVPYTSNSRRTKALWTILGDRGMDVAVVGWWTTWPAEPVRGVMVSDRMLYNRFNLWFGLTHFGDDLPGQTHPPELVDELLPLTRAPDDLEQEFFAQFLPAEPRPELVRDLHDPWYELFLVYARDRAYSGILERLLHDRSFDFVAHYVNGADIASHYFWKYLFPDEWDGPIPEEDLRRYADIIPRYYSWVDSAIGPLLEQAGERCVVIVVSDHGFVTGHRSDSPNISGMHYRTAPRGVIALAGGALPAGVRVEGASVVDVTPTVLHLLGQAVGRDMDGRALPVVVESGSNGAAVRYVDSHDGDYRKDGTEPVATGYDEAIVEKLQALGYLD